MEIHWWKRKVRTVFLYRKATFSCIVNKRLILKLLSSGTILIVLSQFSLVILEVWNRLRTQRVPWQLLLFLATIKVAIQLLLVLITFKFPCETSTRNREMQLLLVKPNHKRKNIYIYIKRKKKNGATQNKLYASTALAHLNKARHHPIFFFFILKHTFVFFLKKKILCFVNANWKESYWMTLLN